MVKHDPKYLPATGFHSAPALIGSRTAYTTARNYSINSHQFILSPGCGLCPDEVSAQEFTVQMSIVLKMLVLNKLINSK